VLISVAAVLTAICGYQSGRWSGVQARLYNLADADRSHATEASDRANVLSAINVALFLQYIDAIDAQNAAKAEFIRKRLPPEMQRAMNAWLATHPLTNPKAPSSPFVMPEYSLPTRAQAKRFEESAASSFAGAQKANEHADAFLLLTVIFAGVSFLGGVSTKMKYPLHAIVIIVGFVALVYGAVRLWELPFLR
jgi:hypothetical protein